MNDLDEFRRKMRAKGTGDPDEFLAKIQQSVDPNQPPYRLELYYDESSKTVILQGNQAGLESLIGHIQRLARPDAVSGAHTHFDSWTNLSDNEDIELIIQRVEGDDMGAHRKKK